jgi:hypothetical protein
MQLQGKHGIQKIKTTIGKGTFEIGHRQHSNRSVHISSSFYKSKICLTTSKINGSS